MFNRTTSFIFSKYGEVFRSMPDDESSFMKNAHVSNVRLRDKQIHYYMNYDRPVYIRALMRCHHADRRPEKRSRKV